MYWIDHGVGLTLVGHRIVACTALPDYQKQKQNQGVDSPHTPPPALAALRLGAGRGTGQILRRPLYSTRRIACAICQLELRLRHGLFRFAIIIKDSRIIEPSPRHSCSAVHISSIIESDPSPPSSINIAPPVLSSTGYAQCTRVRSQDDGAAEAQAALPPRGTVRYGSISDGSKPGRSKGSTPFS